MATLLAKQDNWRLIDDVGAWLSQKHGETDYLLTHLLSEGFQSYLPKIQETLSSDYVFCNRVVNEVEFTFFLEDGMRVINSFI